VRISERSFGIDFITDEQNRCAGVLALTDGNINVIWAAHDALPAAERDSFIANRRIRKSPPPTAMQWRIARALR